MAKSPREGLSQHEKYLGFQKAFETITAYRAAQSWLAAYVVAFSVFEDRLKAARFLTADLCEQPRPTRYQRLYDLVEALKLAGKIGEDVAADWKAAGDKRNDLLHSAMWSLDAVQDQDVLAVIELARAADSIADRLKRELNSKTG